MLHFVFGFRHYDKLLITLGVYVREKFLKVVLGDLHDRHAV